MASNDMSLEEATNCFTIRQLENSTYAITGYDAVKCGKEVNVPSSVDGKQVTLIDDNAFKGKDLTKVSLYYGITEIRYGAFQSNKITDLKLSASIKTIGAYAFYNNQIFNLVLPEGVETIGTSAFRVNKITSVSFPKTLKSIGSSSFMSNQLTEINLNSNASIGSSAFSGNKIVESKAFIYSRNSDGTYNYSRIIGYAGTEQNLVIPGEVNGIKLTSIAGHAFRECKLKTVVLPNTITSIGDYAFYANQITSVNFPAELKTIGDSSFRQNKLTTLNIPDSVTSIGPGAFRNNCVSADNSVLYAKNSDGSWDYSKIISLTGGSTCNIRNITIPATKNGVALKQIVSVAFEGSGLLSITLPDLSQTPNLTIADGAFSNNSIPVANAFYYKITNGKIDYSYISSFAGGGSGTLTIPATAGPNNTPLKKIDSLFQYKGYSAYVIPSTVTTISSSVFFKSAESNSILVKIINKTGRSFDWYSLLGSIYPNPGSFVTGTVKHQAGDVAIVSE